ncbi:hypothetical protein Tco_1535387 [Tanacetum coccineum]
MVGMIRTIKPETYCVVYERVHSIQYESGWCYTGCKACNTRVTPILTKGASSSRNKKQLWHYKKHGETYAVVSWFKIIVRVFDESGSAQIIGKQYLFKTKYTEFNHNNNSHIYRAEKVTEDVETINYFKTGFFEHEVEDEQYTSESNEMIEDAQDDITSPHNEENEDAEDITSPQNEENQDAIDDSTSPSVGKNEDRLDDMTNYEVEEDDDLSPSKKLVTVKLEKDP